MKIMIIKFHWTRVICFFFIKLLDRIKNEINEASLIIIISDVDTSNFVGHLYIYFL